LSLLSIDKLTSFERGRLARATRGPLPRFDVSASSGRWYFWNGPGTVS
jgi:hypothetical protein